MGTASLLCLSPQSRHAGPLALIVFSPSPLSFSMSLGWMGYGVVVSSVVGQPLSISFVL